MNTTANTITSSETTNVSIMVGNKLTIFDYDDLKSFHKGDSWFGCTVGFRAMQLAAREFSKSEVHHETWSRDNLSVISGHPGPGVKDAIELITATISSENFQLLENIEHGVCNSSMRFEWWLTESNKTLHIKLHDDIVPASFLQLLDRLNSDAYTTEIEKENDRQQFDQMKDNLSNTLWSQSLDASFDINYETTPTNNTN